MKEKFKIERRKYIRLNESIKVNYKISGTTLPEEQAISVNISPEGIRFSMKEKLQLNTDVELILYLPDEPEPILIEAEAVWQKKTVGRNQTIRFDTGLKFKHMKDYDKMRFFKYIYDCMYKMMLKQFGTE